MNGKIYIGQTTNTLEVRKGQHRVESNLNRSNMVISKAITKYGFENFIWEVLCECKTQEELNEMEVRYISEYDSYRKGYNGTLGGAGIKGYVYSDEQREKKSKSMLGEKNHRFGKPSPRKGVKISEEHRAKLREAHKGRKVSKPFSDEHIMNKRLAQQGEKGTNAKLKEVDILKIRELYATGEYYQKDLAEMYGVARGTISDIVTKKHGLIFE